MLSSAGAGSAASHLEGLTLFMQSDHLLPLVPDMLPQTSANGNDVRTRGDARGVPPKGA
jgi:hypothetical protein